MYIISLKIILYIIQMEENVKPIKKKLISPELKTEIGKLSTQPKLVTTLSRLRLSITLETQPRKLPNSKFIQISPTQTKRHSHIQTLHLKKVSMQMVSKSINTLSD